MVFMLAFDLWCAAGDALSILRTLWQNLFILSAGDDIAPGIEMFCMNFGMNQRPGFTSWLEW